MEKLQDIAEKLKAIKEALNKSQEAPAQEVVEKSEMNSLDYEIIAKSLEDSGHRQSALLLKTWNEVDNVAKTFVNEYMEKNDKKKLPVPPPIVIADEVKEGEEAAQKQYRDKK